LTITRCERSNGVGRTASFPADPVAIATAGLVAIDLPA
jgi:hypothetical protein